jgi:hypothetical protein
MFPAKNKKGGIIQGMKGSKGIKRMQRNGNDEKNKKNNVPRRSIGIIK